MGDEEYPGFSEEAVLGDKGRRIVENILHDDLGWLFREVDKNDLGIDGYVEVLGEDRASKGRLFAVQIKCGLRYLKEVGGEGYVYRGSLKHLNYWIEYSLPVVLVLCNPVSGSCFWAEITPSSIERTPKGWKVTVPFAQRLDAENRSRLEFVVRRPLHQDLIPFALYRFLIEKFSNIEIASDWETPRDFHGFEFLAHIKDEIVCVNYLYKPTDEFKVSDLDVVARGLEECRRGCGWDESIPDRILLFFVAHRESHLKLSSDVVRHLKSFPQLHYYRLLCDFRFGVSLNELNEDGSLAEPWNRDDDSETE